MFFYQPAIGKTTINTTLGTAARCRHFESERLDRLLLCVCYQRLLISEIMRNQWQNAHMCFLVHDVNNMGINNQLHTG